MNFQGKAEAPYYLMLLEGGPSTDDCFIITLLGIRQMFQTTQQKSARLDCCHWVNRKQQVDRLRRNDFNIFQDSKSLAFHYLLFFLIIIITFVSLSGILKLFSFKYPKHKKYFSLVWSSHMEEISIRHLHFCYTEIHSLLEVSALFL